MTAPRFDSNLLAYLQAWRQYLEQMAGSATMGFGAPTAPQWAVNAAPPIPLIASMPPIPPVPPPALTPPPAFSPAAPMDYTQQLLTTLQAWRQYLEQSLPAQPAPTTPPHAVHQQQPTAQESVPPPAEGPQITAPAHTAAAQPSTPGRRTGSAYATETGSATAGYEPPPPRSLYSSATAPKADGPGATTAWWDGGRPPAGTPKAHIVPLAPPNPQGSEIKVPPELETQAPMIPEGSAAPQAPAGPRTQLVQPSFDRRSR